jgi:hypothetical protein
MSLQKPQERTRPRATRESGMVRGLVDVSYIDDHVRRQTPAGQRGQAPRRASKERSRGLLRWKASPGSGAPVDIDVSLARTRTSDCHKGCSRTPEAAENKGDVRGLDPTERRSAEKATALSGPTEQATRVRARVPIPNGVQVGRPEASGAPSSAWLSEAG